MTEFYIIDLRPQWKKQPYATVWRSNNAGYAWPLPWAGKYDQATIDANPDYYCTKHGRRTYTRFPVPCDIVAELAISTPLPGLIDGNVGPVLLNDGKTRNALRRAKYVPQPSVSEGKAA